RRRRPPRTRRGSTSSTTRSSAASSRPTSSAAFPQAPTGSTCAISTSRSGAMSARPPVETVAESVETEGREALLKFLDRETAIARATGGRLAVLILELRRVDRLHALLRGPAPATTMSLVVERLRKALRPEDRIAPISDEQVCLVLPRLAHPSQAMLAAVKLLRSLDRPIAYEGGSAVLR